MFLFNAQILAELGIEPGNLSSTSILLNVPITPTWEILSTIKFVPAILRMLYWPFVMWPAIMGRLTNCTSACKKGIIPIDRLFSFQIAMKESQSSITETLMEASLAAAAAGSSYDIRTSIRTFSNQTNTTVSKKTKAGINTGMWSKNFFCKMKGYNTSITK